MSAQGYLLCRAGITHDVVSAQRARELYEDAAAQPGANRTGDLDGEFRFWTTDSDGLLLVRCTVTPLPSRR